MLNSTSQHYKTPTVQDTYSLVKKGKLYDWQKNGLRRNRLIIILSLCLICCFTGTKFANGQAKVGIQNKTFCNGIATLVFSDLNNPQIPLEFSIPISPVDNYSYPFNPSIYKLCNVKIIFSSNPVDWFNGLFGPCGSGYDLEYGTCLTNYSDSYDSNTGDYSLQVW